MQNSKSSKMLDRQPLDRVICSSYIDYNLILIFKRDVLINFGPPSPMSPYVPIVVTHSPSREDVLNPFTMRY